MDERILAIKELAWSATLQGNRIDKKLQDIAWDIAEHANDVEKELDNTKRYARKITKMLRRELSNESYHLYDSRDIDAVIEQYGVEAILED